MKHLNLKHLNHNLLKLALVSVLSAGTALVLASPAMISFKSTDSNGDGKVSLEKSIAQGHDQTFREGDANRDSRPGS